MEQRQKRNDAANVIDEWIKLYEKEIPPLVGEGEMTIAVTVEMTDLDHKTAEKLLLRLEKEGKIVSVGKRRTAKGVTVDAWRLV